MAQHGDRARETLLDAAEQLFAHDGIDAVSNRRIVEQAGAANHSAVSYHFGGREGLLRALIERHQRFTSQRRAVHEQQLSETPSVHDLVRVQLMPLFELLSQLPQPTSRARFLERVRASPAASGILAELAREVKGSENARRLAQALEHLPESTVRARASVLAHLVIGGCAEYERQTAAGTRAAQWIDAGYFFVDAAAGMLMAPVTRQVGDMPFAGAPLL